MQPGVENSGFFQSCNHLMDPAHRVSRWQRVASPEHCHPHTKSFKKELERIGVFSAAQYRTGLCDFCPKKACPALAIIICYYYYFLTIDFSLTLVSKHKLFSTRVLSASVFSVVFMWCSVSAGLWETLVKNTRLLFSSPFHLRLFMLLYSFDLYCVIQSFEKLIWKHSLQTTNCYWN